MAGDQKLDEEEGKGTLEWAEVPRAGRWLEEAGGSRSDGLSTVSTVLGHVVVVGSPYHVLVDHPDTRYESDRNLTRLTCVFFPVFW